MARYTEAHANPQGAGDARPTALQIVKDEGVEGKLGGKVIVLTGATSGIGLETARALKATGATLILTGRDPAKGKAALGEIMDGKQVHLVKMDNASLESVRVAAREILAIANNKVDILIANAGVMGIPELQLTEDGHEVHFATKYLSHFLLFQLLEPALLSAVTPESHSRVVIVASSAHRSGTLPASDNYDFQKGRYEHMLAYANANLADVYLANQIDRVYGSRGLHANSVHPGAINTNIGRHIGAEATEQIMTNPFVVRILKSSQQGAATTVLAAVGKEWEDKGGQYLEDCEASKRGRDDGDVFGVGWVKQTYNQKEEERLWQDSLAMVGLA